jgi:hypothetical protein
MRAFKIVFAVAVVALLAAAAAHSRQKQASDSDYIAQASPLLPKPSPREQPSFARRPTGPCVRFAQAITDSPA